MKLKTSIKSTQLRCENCGVELSSENLYAREIEGETHYFCCSHCADAFERRGRNG
ncbi:MAG: transcriptional regulator [Thermocladium sp.]